VFENNVMSMQGLLESIRSSGVKIRMLLFASSGGVYGKPEALPITESVVVRPIDGYAQSKYAAETLACEFAVKRNPSQPVYLTFSVWSG
jgi:UDP-glucose 4-epimerase